MKRISKWTGVLLTLISLVVWWPVSASAQTGAAISLSPASATANVGDTVNVNILVSNATNTYGVEVHMTFDPARLQVLDEDPALAGVQILPGSLFPRSDPSYVAQNKADNIAGTIDFAITLLAPESPINGGGTLATVRFSAQMAGVAQLGWSSTQMATPDGVAIPHTRSGGQIAISTPTVPTPGRNCTDLISNGTFEANAAWTMPVTPHKANYSTADKHGGSRSVRLGIEPGDPDVYSHSSAYQKIHVPSTATGVTLTFWARRFTQDTPKAQIDPTVDQYDPADVINGTLDWAGKGTRVQNDWQEVLILQAGCYNWLATLMRDRSNDGTWTQYSYDLTAFAGQDIVVYFNTINNGNGLRTWMFVDDVQVLACYDAAPCADAVRNRSFEFTADWTRANTPRPADYTTDAHHTGARSMRLGIVPPTGDTYSHSSAYQSIVVPAGAPNPTLTFWYQAHSEDTTRTDWKSYDFSNYDPGKVIRGEKGAERCCGEIDWQEMLLLDSSYRLLSGGVVLRQVQNDGVWRQATYDLSPYKGMTIVLYFNVINDGNGKRTWMYVDDVSVNACGQLVRFEPPTQTVAVGQVFTADVRVENISDLYGLETVIRFDPALLEVQDADAATAGVQVSRGAFLPTGAHIVANSADNTTGLIQFAATLLAPAPALNGSGSLISMSFRAKASGSTPLAFNSLKLVNSGAVVIPVSRTDGQVTVTTNQATLTGQVLLEGRSNHSGTVVQLDGGPTVTTGSDGMYSFTAAGGAHTLAFSHPSYLAATRTATGIAGSTVTVPTLTLLGGDVNGDGHINIMDLSAVGSQFGSTTPSPATADINGDGRVDIVDIVLVAKNFGS